MLYKIITAKC